MREKERGRETETERYEEEEEKKKKTMDKERWITHHFMKVNMFVQRMVMLK